MKLQNTTDYPDRMLRRIVSFCAREIGVSPKIVRRATFRNRGRGRHWSGHAYAGRIVVSIGTAAATWPHKWSHCKSYTPATGEEFVVDRVEALIGVTAHEIGHVADYRRGRYTGRGAEARVDAGARFVVRKFRERRDELLAAWNAAPAATEPADAEPEIRIAAIAAAPEAPAADEPAEDLHAARQRRTLAAAGRRAGKLAKARADLTRWERKLKLAKTKATKYGRLVKRLEKAAK
jgi:hypothetical protein